jgi:hypothetical protein
MQPLAIGLLMVTAQAQACEEQTIDSTDGNTVTLDDGSTYAPNNGDHISNWSDGDTVLLKDGHDQMLNKDAYDDDPVDVEEQ